MIVCPDISLDLTNFSALIREAKTTILNFGKDISSNLKPVFDTSSSSNTATTTHVQGYARDLTPTFATGGTVGREEDALVNELGNESYVRGNKLFLIPGGPHIQHFKPNDIIFNAEQTRDLIETGKTAKFGKVFNAHADGTYGNVDLNSRKKIKWTPQNLKRYERELASWGAKPKVGSYSTVMGGSMTIDGIEIAYSPIQQTKNGAILLSKQAVDEYIHSILNQVKQKGSWTTEDLLALDYLGLIADVGANARKTGKEMHSVSEAIEKNKKKTRNKVKNKKARALGTAYISGHNWTVGHEEDALVNEIGNESYIRGNRLYLIPGGPHIEHFKPNDVIFNADQTRDLVEAGKTLGFGNVINAHANGTTNGMPAHATYSPYNNKNASYVTFSNTAIAGPKRYEDGQIKAGAS
jgi:hypothetical protein